MVIKQEKFQFDDGAVAIGLSRQLQDTFGQTPSRRAAIPPIDHGHRYRLRARFGVDHGTAMPDYELLELVLAQTFRQGDTKPLAKLLLKTFGDLNAVIAASPEQLNLIPGVGEKVVHSLKLIEAIAHRMARNQLTGRDVLSSWDAVLKYCRTVLANQDSEFFRVLYLDRKNVLIADELQGKGTVDHVPVYPREIVKRGIVLNASAIVLIHNHPSGDPQPSEGDIRMTEKIVEAVSTLGIIVHDHLVIGKGAEFSFRSAGLIR